MGQLEKIAKLAGVSQSTVSRVVNKPDLVSGKTRDLVFAAMEEVGFLASKKVAEHKRQVVGLAIPDMSIDINWEWIKGIERELDKTPYSLTLFHTKRRDNLAAYFKEHVDFRQKVDGLIILSSELDREAVELFRSLYLPVVLVQNRSEDEKSISTNNYLGASDAVGYLLSRGYKKIGYIGWHPTDARGSDRYRGYTATLENAGVAVDENLVTFVPLSREGGYEATQTLLSRGAPDALFYACDSLAFGGYQYCKEQNIKIPKDLGIMGFDDLEMAAVIGLTTMRQFIQVKSNMAVEYLLKRLSSPEEEVGIEEFCVTPRLVVRHTTR